MGKYNEQLNDDYLLKNNLLGITDFKSLEDAEAFVFSFRASQIEQGAYQIKDFQVQDLKNLHKHLFQDIYSFAGQFRDVQLMIGSTRFCQFQFIDSYAQDLFKQLNNETKWHSLTQAAERLTYFKSELNMLHPFREGNGRTIRIFLYTYALSQGFVWNYTEMDNEEYLHAMIQSVTNTELLEKLFQKTLSVVA